MKLYKLCRYNTEVSRQVSSDTMYTVIGGMLAINHCTMHLVVLFRLTRFKSSSALVGIDPVTHTVNREIFNSN